MNYQPEPAHVEIVDGRATAEDGTFLAPDRVLINGHDIGVIAENGVRIDPGDALTVARVTITLIPRRIDIRPAEDFTVGDGMVLPGN